MPNRTSPLTRQPRKLQLLFLAVFCLLSLMAAQVKGFVAAVKHVAVIEHPLLWFAAVMAVLFLAVRRFNSRTVRIGTIVILLGLTLNATVIRANGAMPVMGMASLQPINSTWQAAGPDTKLSVLADQADLAFFSIGDIVFLVGGLLVLLHRVPLRSVGI